MTMVLECFDVNVQDEDGNAPLHIACRMGELMIVSDFEF